jgi:hypothetical protein
LVVNLEEVTVWKDEQSVSDRARGIGESSADGAGSFLVAATWVTSDYDGRQKHAT